MKIGIVGAEAAKFTPATEAEARRLIRLLLEKYQPEAVISGKCHLGGVDLYAIEEARRLGIATTEYPPANHDWMTGYKPRNIQIAEASDLVVCFTLRTLPSTYTGMRFGLCYHCKTPDHVKSGGCWTAKYARGLGKRGETIVVETLQ